MPNYDQQFLVSFQEVKSKVAKEAADALIAKAAKVNLKSTFIEYGWSKMFSLGRPLAASTDNSRVYLLGHTDWLTQKFGNWGSGPKRTAEILAKNLGLRAAKVISIIGCGAGADKGAADDARLATSIDSFASRLHVELGNTYNVRTTVYARIWNVAVSDDGTKRVGLPGDDEGQHKLAGSKAKFYWAGGNSVRQIL